MKIRFLISAVLSLLLLGEWASHATDDGYRWTSISAGQEALEDPLAESPEASLEAGPVDLSFGGQPQCLVELAPSRPGTRLLASSSHSEYYLQFRALLI